MPVNERNTYPHFLCIGAQKGGTTWLYENLKAHPEVCLTQLKEVRYFDTRSFSLSQLCRMYTWKQVLKNNLIKGIFRQSPAQTYWYFSYLFYRRSDSWYSSLFRNCDGRVIGDITPSYSMLGEKEIEHVASIMPRAKIILLLRNPIERTWSHARMDLRIGVNSHLSRLQRTSIKSVTLDEWRRHFDSHYSVRYSDYLSILQKWRSQFPATQVFIGYLEEIENTPVSFLEKLSEFLGIEPCPAQGWPFAERRVNAQTADEMPPEIAHYLSQKYVGFLQALEDSPMLDGKAYVRNWRKKAERCLADATP
jgi:hypothetical protein